MLGDTEHAAAGDGEALGSLTLDGAATGLDAREHRARARRCAHGARRDQRGDVGGDQHDRARAARQAVRGRLGRRGRPAGPYLASQYVKERTALIWGVADRSMLRDEAKCFLDAGGMIEVSDMVLRMLRIALPSGERAPAATATR